MEITVRVGLNKNRILIQRISYILSVVKLLSINHQFFNFTDVMFTWEDLPKRIPRRFGSSTIFFKLSIEVCLSCFSVYAGHKIRSFLYSVQSSSKSYRLAFLWTRSCDLIILKTLLSSHGCVFFLIRFRFKGKWRSIIVLISVYPMCEIPGSEYRSQFKLEYPRPCDISKGLSQTETTEQDF